MWAAGGLSQDIGYIRAPAPRSKVSAEYSREARIAELEGSVAFAATIAPDGAAHDLRLVDPPGIGLDDAVEAAALRWSFVPGLTEDGPAPMLAMIELEFLSASKQSRRHLLRAEFGTPRGA